MSAKVIPFPKEFREPIENPAVARLVAEIKGLLNGSREPTNEDEQRLIELFKGEMGR